MSREPLVQALSPIAGTLLYLGNVEGGIFSRITMTSMTSAWYLELLPYEAILVGLVILEVLLMRYLLILPLDLSKLMDKGILLASVVSKKRKRRNVMTAEEIVKAKRLADTLTEVVRHVDKNECFLRSLCELRWYDLAGYDIPSQLSTCLSTLKMIGNNNRYKELDDTNLKPLVKSVEAGDRAWEKYPNSTSLCLSTYHLCHLKENEIIKSLDSYFKILKHAHE